MRDIAVRVHILQSLDKSLFDCADHCQFHIMLLGYGSSGHGSAWGVIMITARLARVAAT